MTITLVLARTVALSSSCAATASVEGCFKVCAAADTHPSTGAVAARPLLRATVLFERVM
ncbi:hypothetical protein GGR91_000559 [Sphingorhabdus rigui]|uniref:Uncharacterized protein n=1 Tax=Sphingorhabdus rigui TaxID=1282858 RepID=A0A840AZB1_9SPHN|nr:hypothetical protein [Sphingorhabdus rigui]